MVLKLMVAVLLGAASIALASGAAECSKREVVSSHVLNKNGSRLDYDATVGYLDTLAANGKSHACLFFTAYTARPLNLVRPIVFAFNGGPSFASLWLHLGGLGPRRLDLGPEGTSLAAPPRIIENENSLLDRADLVFIDPVGTGYSTLEGSAGLSDFSGAHNDAVQLANFIRNYLAHKNRWASPKFLAGESYGGVRAALAAKHLQEHDSIQIAGLILISPLLLTTAQEFPDPGNDLAPIDYLPSYAMAARYHGRIGSRLQSQSSAHLRAEVETFAMSLAAKALLLGSDLDPQQRFSVAEQISEYTAIPADVIERTGLRLTPNEFRARLLETKGLKIGRIDSRMTGPLVPDWEKENPYNDPSLSPLTREFSSAINSYYPDQLGFAPDVPYIPSVQVGNWPFDSDGQEFGVLNDIRDVMLENLSMKVYVAAGLYDLAIPYFASRYNVRHILSPGQDLRSRIRLGLYESGHMVYAPPACLRQLRTDLNWVISPASGPLSTLISQQNERHF